MVAKAAVISTAFKKALITYPFDLLIVEGDSWSDLDNACLFQVHDLFLDSLSLEVIGIWDLLFTFCF